jgi:hypothetical protein
MSEGEQAELMAAMEKQEEEKANKQQNVIEATASGHDTHMMGSAAAPGSELLNIGSIATSLVNRSTVRKDNRRDNTTAFHFINCRFKLARVLSLSLGRQMRERVIVQRQNKGSTYHTCISVVMLPSHNYGM